MPLDDPQMIRLELSRFAESKFNAGVRAGVTAVFNYIAEQRPNEPILDLIAARWPAVKSRLEEMH